MLHPSQQVLQYKQCLEDSSTVFSDGKSAADRMQLSLQSPAQHRKCVGREQFTNLLAHVPMFSGDETHEFGQLLR